MQTVFTNRTRQVLTSTSHHCRIRRLSKSSVDNDSSKHLRTYFHLLRKKNFWDADPEPEVPAEPEPEPPKEEDSMWDFGTSAKVRLHHVKYQKTAYSTDRASYARTRKKLLRRQERPRKRNRSLSKSLLLHPSQPQWLTTSKVGVPRKR